MIYDYLQLTLYIVVLLLCIRPVGRYIAGIFDDQNPRRLQVLQRLENGLLRVARLSSQEEMTAKQYMLGIAVFSVMSIVFVYGIQRIQGWLPLNPQRLPGVPNDLSWNTAISFVTNTNWQAYAGESTMSYFTQMVAFTSQNFLSAAVGLSVFVAFTRGFQRGNSSTIGNFYVDTVRGVVHLLLPLSILLALGLVSQGVVQNFSSSVKTHPLEAREPDTAGAMDYLAMGPVASQVAIKQLGSNGGGFFNANSAHPLENPTPFSNFLQMVAILLLPASLCITFGELVRDRRQGWAIFASMSLVFVPLVIATYCFERVPNPQLEDLGINASSSSIQAGGNMEGKETRFGIVNSSLWAVATTATSNGSVNSMHDSFTPLGGMIPLWLIQLGEVIFGGIGSGMVGMIVFAIVTVFVSGLMVGRTPEYLGKKIGVFEMQMVSIAILVPCITVLLGTAIAVVTELGSKSMFNPGPHGFSEVLYAYSSAGNNNGSAFAGLNANTPFLNATLSLAMLLGRFCVMFPVLAIAGSLASKGTSAPGPGTLPTHTPLFISLLISIVVLVGALSFLPSLALGPIVEHLLLHSTH